MFFHASCAAVCQPAMPYCIEMHRQKLHRILPALSTIWTTTPQPLPEGELPTTCQWKAECHLPCSFTTPKTGWYPTNAYNIMWKTLAGQSHWSPTTWPPGCMAMPSTTETKGRTRAKKRRDDMNATLRQRSHNGQDKGRKHNAARAWDMLSRPCIAWMSYVWE